VKNCANRKDILLKYKIYKALKNKIPILKISKIYKVSTKTIIEIKKNGFYKIDNIKLIINEILEKEPKLTLSQIKLSIKQQYNINLSLSTIYYKLSKTLDKRLVKIVELLIEDEEYDEAVKILSQFLYLLVENFYLLETITDTL